MAVAAAAPTSWEKPTYKQTSWSYLW
jgi:hypothetical protein